jgi:hypothetical protein
MVTKGDRHERDFKSLILIILVAIGIFAGIKAYSLFGPTYATWGPVIETQVEQAGPSPQ